MPRVSKERIVNGQAKEEFREMFVNILLSEKQDSFHQRSRESEYLNYILLESNFSSDFWQVIEEASYKFL